MENTICTGDPNHGSCKFSVLTVLIGESCGIKDTSDLFVSFSVIAPLEPGFSSLYSTKCAVPNKAIVLQIPLDFIEKYIPDVQQFMFIWDYQTKDPVKKTKLDMLKTTLEQLQIIDDIRPDGFILRFNSLIFELLFQLCHNFSVKVFQIDLSRLKKDLDRLNLVLNYISENYKRPISLDEIAGVAYLQTGYFCRFFKKKMGVTFMEYQNEYRLSFIYKDLINTKDPVHVILERHGFTNYKLFRRMFQEHFGCTPTKVRENMRK